MKEKKPNSLRRLTKEEIWLIVAATTAILALAFLSLTTQCYGPMAGLFQISLLLTLCFFGITAGIVVWVAIQHYQNCENHGLSALLDERKFKDFCFQNRLYLNSYFDPDEILFPKIILIEHGFKVDAMPGIASKIADSKDAFNDFLAVNGSDLIIVDVEAPGNGWIYFYTEENFKKDGLKNEW